MGNKPRIGKGDGVMIAGDVRALACQYCARGNRAISYQQYDQLSHTPGAAAFLPGAFSCLNDRFIGKPAPNGCGAIAPATHSTPRPETATASTTDKARRPDPLDGALCLRPIAVSCLWASTSPEPGCCAGCGWPPHPETPGRRCPQLLTPAPDLPGRHGTLSMAVDQSAAPTTTSTSGTSILVRTSASSEVTAFPVCSTQRSTISCSDLVSPKHRTPPSAER